MNYLKKLILSLFIFIAIFASESIAAEITVFDSMLFTREEGKQTTYAETFSNLPIEGDAFLLIQTDNTNSNTKISSAIVKINGDTVLKPNDFNHSISKWRIPIVLRESNLLEVELGGKPGNSLNVKVVLDVDADAAAIIGPDGGVIEVESGPLVGTKVIAPKKSLSPGTIITIKEDRNPTQVILPIDFKQSGHFISFETTKPFLRPIFIALPFEGGRYEDEVRILFTFNDITGEWEAVPPLPTPDPEILIAQVEHFSTYTKASATISSVELSTGFDIPTDAMQFQNGESDCEHDPDGEGICVGMSQVASTYFREFAETEKSGLYCQWGEQTSARVACDVFGAFNGKLQFDEFDNFFEYWINVFSSLIGVLDGISIGLLDDGYVIDYVKYNVYFNYPTVLNIIDNDGGDGHSVLATGWKKTGAFTGEIELYDVNNNNKFMKATYSDNHFNWSELSYKYYDLFFIGTSFGLDISSYIEDIPSENACEPPPRFLDNSNGTITDNTTGLIWQKGDSGYAMTWTSALSYCSNLNLGGSSNWRLASKNELLSIVDKSRIPTIPSIFHAHNWYYKTSTSYSSGWAWIVSFKNGRAYIGDKPGYSYARCVQ